jgi:transcriptional regulator with XRE-family HTH domain
VFDELNTAMTNKLKKPNFRNDLLESRRQELGISFARLANASGLSRSTLYEILRGSTADPTASTLKKTCRALRLNPKFALDDELKKSQFHLAEI